MLAILELIDIMIMSIDKVNHNLCHPISLLISLLGSADTKIYIILINMCISNRIKIVVNV
jgi:hypothetical protein